MFPEGIVPGMQEVHNGNLKTIPACRKGSNYSVGRDNTFLSRCSGDQERIHSALSLVSGIEEAAVTFFIFYFNASTDYFIQKK